MPFIYFPDKEKSPFFLKKFVVLVTKKDISQELGSRDRTFPRLLLSGVSCTKDGECYLPDGDIISRLKNAFKGNKTKYTSAKF